MLSSQTTINTRTCQYFNEVNNRLCMHRTDLSVNRIKFDFSCTRSYIPQCVLILLFVSDKYLNYPRFFWCAFTVLFSSRKGLYNLVVFQIIIFNFGDEKIFAPAIVRVLIVEETVF